MISDRLFIFILALAAGLVAGVASAAAQVASYGSGSIHDLDPPSAQATGGRYLETIVVSRRLGRMRELRDFHPNDHMRQIARPVGRLALAVRRGDVTERAFCTAALVAEDLILTNHHCIAGNPDGEVEDALLWMGYLVPRALDGVRRYGVELDPVEADAALDYALHRVRGRPGREWGTVTLDPEAEIFGGKSLFIVHHPGGWQQHVSLACETGRPARGPEGLLHVCDTLGGSSGAPVFSRGGDRVVGLHYRLVIPGELNAAKPIAEIVAASPTLRRILRESAPEPAPTPAALAWAVIRETKDVATLERFARSFPGSPEAAEASERASILGGMHREREEIVDVAPRGIQQAVLYEEATQAGEPGSAVPGSVEWSMVRQSVGGGDPEPVVRANAAIPDRGLNATITIRENRDSGLPASHRIEIAIDVPDGFEGGGAKNVPGIIMKETEQARGEPLRGAAARVGSGVFWIALSEGANDRQKNLRLLSERDWIDIPILYESGRRAILTLRKGHDGFASVEAAIRAWRPG